MAVSDIDEPISVGAVFKEGRIIPRWFTRGQTKHLVQSVNMVWKGKEGEAPLRWFSVMADGNTYQLRLNQKTLEWRLDKVSVEEA